MLRLKLMRHGLAAAILAGGCAFPGVAQITLDAENLRQAAAVSLKEGDSARALAYADALLQRDKDDLTALLIRARALRDLGDLPPARTAAREAWNLAETDGEKYSTALITAQVLSSSGKRTRAQLWLRRAVQHAPNQRLEAKAKRDFAFVKTRNPWSTQLSFTIAPNSNINNGSARERVKLNYIVWPLSGDARALSGIEYGGAVRSRYRFKETPKTAHDLKIGLSYRTFTLTSSAEALAPDTKGSDFAYGTASLGYGFQQRNMDNKGTLGIDLETGQSWYGGARYATFLRSSFHQKYHPSAELQYRFGLTAERQWGQATPDVDNLILSTGLTRRFESGNSGYMGFSARATQSPSPDSEFSEVMFHTGFVLGKPVMGTALQFGLGAAYRDYDVSRHSRDGRQDKRFFADVTATFEEIDYYGFNPSMTLSASHTESNIDLFDTRRFGLSVGIKSAF